MNPLRCYISPDVVNFFHRYHKLLAEFTARKLPRFYQKYGNRPKVNKKEIPDFYQQKTKDLIPPVVPIEKYLDTAVPIRKRRFFEVG